MQNSDLDKCWQQWLACINIISFFLRTGLLDHNQTIAQIGCYSFIRMSIKQDFETSESLLC